MKDPYRKTRPKYRQFMLKNNQSDLQVTMICVLSKFCGFEISKPQKNVKVTKEFLKIKYIRYKRERLSVKEFKERRFEEIKTYMMKHENITETCFKHRLEQIRRREVMHLLEDMLLQLGIFVYIETEENNGFSGDSIIYGREEQIKLEEYETIADGVREYIRLKMGNKTKVKIEKGELLQFIPEGKLKIFNK